MTIEELYKLAVVWGCENKPLILDYSCSDTWYSYTEPIHNNEIKFTTDGVIINIDN